MAEAHSLITAQLWRDVTAQPSFAGLATSVAPR